MTTFTDFTPSTAAAFQFQPTLDGSTYKVTVTWNVFGQRYYINVAALDGTAIITTALVGSPTGIALENLAWADGVATATTSEPHGYSIGTVVPLTISGATPDAFNGMFDCSITGPLTFTFDLSGDPGVASVFGTVSYDINMLGGVPDENGDFFTSTLVFREQSQQFEVSP